MVFRSSGSLNVNTIWGQARNSILIYGDITFAFLGISLIYDPTVFDLGKSKSKAGIAVGIEVR